MAVSRIGDDGVMASGSKRRGFESVGDMVLSLAVVLGVVAVVVLLNLRNDPAPVKTVDYRGAAVQARSLASYDVLVPDGLGPTWRATSARSERVGGAVEWHVGFVTPSSAYAGLEQSDGASAKFVDRFADGARPAGSTTLAGRQWRRLEGGHPEARALVSTRAGVTTVVAGGASWLELDDLAGSLRSAQG